MASTPPQEFLTPVITSELDNPLQGLEEFFLDEGDEKKSEKDDTVKPPQSQTLAPSGHATYSRPLIESSAESVLAAARAKNVQINTSSSSSSSQLPQSNASPTQTYPSWNAVHMEVQSNAKLPTFNLSVNRSNSLGGLQIPAPRGRRSYGLRRPVKNDGGSSAASSVSGSQSDNLAPTSPIPKLRQNTIVDPSLKLDNETSQAIDEILRLNENDMNLSEVFLDEDRSSAALAYSSYRGVPKAFDIPEIDSKTSLNGEVAKLAPRSQSLSSSKVLYTRKKPLPIPGSTPEKKRIHQNEKANSTTVTSTNLAQAIATAAAIATTTPSVSGVAPGDRMDKSTAAALSVQPTKISQTAMSRPSLPETHPTMSLATRQVAPSVTISAQPQTYSSTYGHTAHSASQVNTSIHIPAKAPAPYPTSTSYQPITRPPSTSHAAAHATTKASLAYAQSQRSSYGYGVNHRVIGVPAPPPNNRRFPQQQHNVNVQNHPASGAPYVPIYKAPLLPEKVRAPSTTTPTKPKFDKDKKPSVDSEDPAYERKKQRAKDARVRLNESLDELGVAIELAGTQSRERLHNLSYANTDPPTFTPLQKVMVDTTAQADNAKKWDRPTFVGLAAIIIHSLNAQCDGLMREMISLKREHEMLRHDTYGAGNVSPDASTYYPYPTRNNSDALNEPNLKRQKIDDATSIISGKLIICNDTTVEEERQQTIQDVVGSSKFLHVVAQFLDPPALCRCLCVSKEWISFDVFQNQQTWLSLCYKRFGTWSVRKWEGDEDDEEEANASRASPSMDLYCRMVEGNVKPYSSLDGSIFLGGSSLDGLVSGWVSLVERSNGETSRSALLTKMIDGKPHCYYSSIPVVELRILVQNTGYSSGAIYIPDQHFSVDASTRRKSEKLLEINSDDRFKRSVLHLQKANNSEQAVSETKHAVDRQTCRLDIFQYAILSVHIHARGCSTASKFCHRGKSIQVLVSINGTTRPLIIPISGQH